MTALASVFCGARIMPVPAVPSATTADPLADAIAAGGARCAEVIFRTPDVERVLRAMAAHGGSTVGTGTVLTPQQAERAVEAGARSAISPLTTPGDVSMASLAEVEALMAGGSVHVRR